MGRTIIDLLIYFFVMLLAPLDGFPVTGKQSNDILSDTTEYTTPTDTGKPVERAYTAYTDYNSSLFEYWALKRKYTLNTNRPNNLNGSNS